MDLAPLAVLAPSALIALTVLIIAVRPSAAPAVVEVLRALAGVIGSVVPWNKDRPTIPAPQHDKAIEPGAVE